MRPSANFARDLLKNPIVAVEVGVNEAENALDLLAHWDLNHLHLIDNVRDGIKPINIGINKLRSYGVRITWHLITSQEASCKFQDNSLDYVYIDAGHSHAEVTSDISLWLPKVRVGGILAGHDVGTQGIDTAIAEYFKGNCTIGYPDWWIVKENDG
jgi:hypothetical protein